MKPMPISKERLAQLNFLIELALSETKNGKRLSEKTQRSIRSFLSLPWKEIGRRSREYYRWRKAVLERDKKCRKCGSKKDLIVHHLKPFLTNLSLRVEISNGMVLCRKCHRKVHKAKK